MFNFFKKKSATAESPESRLAYIKSLGEKNSETKKKKKGNAEDMDSKFNQLINFLEDESPDCRIAAAEILGKTGRDVAFTHISQQLDHEKDERVIKALKEALINVRAHEKD